MSIKSMKLGIGPACKRAAEGFLEAAPEQFRRSDLSKVLYPLTKPTRSMDLANDMADHVMKQWAKDGQIQRHGHLHWTKVTQSRTLIGGRIVPEMAKPVELTVNTRCPEKWISIDRETGEVWVGSVNGWTRATSDQLKDVLAFVGCAK